MISNEATTSGRFLMCFANLVGSPRNGHDGTQRQVRYLLVSIDSNLLLSIGWGGISGIPAFFFATFSPALLEAAPAGNVTRCNLEERLPKMKRLNLSSLTNGLHIQIGGAGEGRCGS